MGWYLRKGLNVGPFRLNLSRSGLGASVGIPGFRVGVGPRGSYLHAGRGGLYYRQSIRPRPATPSAPLAPGPAAPPSPVEPLREIDGTDVGQLVDPDAAGLLEQLSLVQRRARTRPLVALAMAVLAVSLWWAAAPRWSLALLPILAAVAFVAATRYDTRRCRMAIEYALDPPIERAFADVVRGFNALVRCDTVWHIGAEGDVRDRKRQAGAHTLVRRTAVRAGFGKPSRLDLNIEVPTLPAGRQSLYLFPDRMLVYERQRVGAVRYDELEAVAGQTRFIEEDRVPTDARVVGQTWRYVNKSGGPDRRFSDNRELPVVLYGELSLRSRTGLNERFQYSRPDAGEDLAAALARLRHALAGEESQPPPATEPASSPTPARRKGFFDS